MAFAGLYFLSNQPLSHLLDQTTNHLVYRSGGLKQNIGKQLIRFGLANDWNAHAGEIDTSKTRNPLLSAANSDRSFHYQRYDTSGMPKAAVEGPFLAPGNSQLIKVNTTNELVSAIASAQPGDIIAVEPGHYQFSTKSIPIRQPGTAERPIYLRSEYLGAAIFEMDTLEGFHVMAPFWVFENLEMRGVCGNDGRCEHAIHVTGNGHSFTLRNSELTDFNAPIKVNGSNNGKYFPDNGLLEYNQFSNSRPRKTDSPVTLLNINSVSNWVVRGNFIADFSKDGGDHTSYGAFMKGGGSNGLFEGNLIICEHRLAPDRGIRIGLSFGGGGTAAKFCRNTDCSSEHKNGLIRNNIILNCSRDVGIYLNRSGDSHLYNNLLHNTLGIDVRYSTSSATLINNLISGRIKARDGGNFKAQNNLIDRHCVGESRSNCSFDEVYAAPGIADLRLKRLDKTILGKGSALGEAPNDLCGKLRGKLTDLGPIQYSGGLDCIKP